MIARRAAVIVAALALLVAVVGAAVQIKVTPVVTDGRVLASFTAPDAWTAETREILQTGYIVTFTYEVELRRPSTLWLDALLARATITASAKFDTLTGDYLVTRQRDGRVVRVERPKQEAGARDWLTSVEQVELQPEDPLKENTDYYVQVRLYTSPRRSVSLWAVLPGGSNDGSGRAPFTYIR